ncbi:MAG: hypothetical protein M4579_000544 [Chaenotheca gracillima]|nr:MAG: hypothetical protein M4579_000544 [Chaenotheca gracillima]
MALFALSPRFPRLAFFARLLASYLALLACAAYGVFASIALRIVGYGGVSQWAAGRAFKWVMRVTTGVGVKIEGREHLQTRPAVFIGNHQSTVFIDRSNRENALAAFSGAASEMRKQKQSVFIFPEGTRSYYAEPDLLPFKKGAFHLAIQAQVPVVPIIVANYSDILHVPSRIFKSGTLHIKVLPPIPTKNLSPADADELTRTTRDLMLKELVQLTSRSRAEGARSDADGEVLKSTGLEHGRRKVDGRVASTS